MKKSPPQKKSAEAATTCKKKAVPCKKLAKKGAETKAVVPKKQRSPSATPAKSAKNKVDTFHSPQSSTSLSENSPPMISLKDCTGPAVSYKTQPRKKTTRTKNGRSKIVHNRAFYNPDEVDFELEDQEFLDDELISLEEFDSILNKTEENFSERNFEKNNEIAQIDHHKTEACLKDSPHDTGFGRRKKVQRRRQIDPTTCERDYTPDEVEFMTALDEYKRNSGRMFPTCSEILEVLLGLGYAKVAPVSQEQTVVANSMPAIGEKFFETQTLTLTVDNFMPENSLAIVTVGVEYNQAYLPFLSNDSLPVVELSTLPDGFSV